MNVEIQEAARRDLSSAFDHYLHEGSSALAERFINEFERVVRLLQQQPGVGSPALRGRRTFPLKDFPYSAVYRVRGKVLVIHAVRHQRRRPLMR